MRRFGDVFEKEQEMRVFISEELDHKSKPAEIGLKQRGRCEQLCFHIAFGLENDRAVLVRLIEPIVVVFLLPEAYLTQLAR